MPVGRRSRRRRGRRGMTPLKARLIALYTLLVGANIAVGLWAFVLFSDDSVKLGTALLAYGLGLRHAVDADHIAAIDNGTRKMMETGARPVTLGLHFSLGHSAVVFALTAAIVATAAKVAAALEPLREVTAMLGTGLSSLFLAVMAATN